MPLYSKNREISDNELEQVLGGNSTFGGSMLKYQIETDLEMLSTRNPTAYAQLSAAKEQLIAQGGRRIFNNPSDSRVQSFVQKMKSARR